MKISQNCLNVIMKWEGFFLDAYLDPVDIPTIGYGTIRYPNGVKVRLGDKITKAEAEAFLKLECDEIVESLETILTGVSLNQNQFDAVVSLCYNIGVGGFSGSTVLRKLKASDFAGASEAFDLWNKGTVKGVLTVLPGLVNRRKDERLLFEKSGTSGVPINIEVSPQSTVTWLEGYREGSDNIVVAMAGSTVVEILVLKSPIKEDLIAVLQQYKNAQNFNIAPAGKAVPSGIRVEVSSKGQVIPRVAGNSPTLERPLLVIGMRDDDSGITGSDIKELQQRLVDLGFYSGKIDGIFGKGTDDAVKRFQADQFGIAKADGKVGPKTWGKLWGSATPIPPVVGVAGPGVNYLKLTKTSVKDPSGCFKLKLEYFKNGQSIDFIEACSGQPTRQFFRKGVDSVAGSFEPLPEGKWYINNIVWADGKDNYNGSVFDSGIGPASRLHWK
jgi:lysozyme